MINIITLLPAERRLAKFIAEQRRSINRQRGVAEKQYNPTHDGSDRDLNGFAAELAFARWINCYPDLCLEQEYPVADVITHQLGGVDVKCPHGSNQNLVIAYRKRTKLPQAYALMLGQMPTFKFVGWIEGARALSQEFKADLGYGPCFIVPRSKLNPPDTIRRVLSIADRPNSVQECRGISERGNSTALQQGHSASGPDSGSTHRHKAAKTDNARLPGEKGTQ